MASFERRYFSLAAIPLIVASVPSGAAALTANWAVPRLGVVATLEGLTGYRTWQSFCTADGQVTVNMTVENVRRADTDFVTFNTNGGGSAHLSSAAGDYWLSGGNSTIQPGCYTLSTANLGVSGTAVAKISLFYNGQTASLPAANAPSSQDAYQDALRQEQQRLLREQELRRAQLQAQQQQREREAAARQAELEKQRQAEQDRIRAASEQRAAAARAAYEQRVADLRAAQERRQATIDAARQQAADNYNAIVQRYNNQVSAINAITNVFQQMLERQQAKQQLDEANAEAARQKESADQDAADAERTFQRQQAAADAEMRNADAAAHSPATNDRSKMIFVGSRAPAEILRHLPKALRSARRTGNDSKMVSFARRGLSAAAVAVAATPDRYTHAEAVARYAHIHRFEVYFVESLASLRPSRDPKARALVKVGDHAIAECRKQLTRFAKSEIKRDAVSAGVWCDDRSPAFAVDAMIYELGLNGKEIEHTYHTTLVRVSQSQRHPDEYPDAALFATILPPAFATWKEPTTRSEQEHKSRNMLDVLGSVNSILDDDESFVHETTQKRTERLSERAMYFRNGNRSLGYSEDASEALDNAMERDLGCCGDAVDPAIAAEYDAARVRAYMLARSTRASLEMRNPDRMLMVSDLDPQMVATPAPLPARRGAGAPPGHWDVTDASLPGLLLQSVACKQAATTVNETYMVFNDYAEPLRAQISARDGPAGSLAAPFSDYVTLPVGKSTLLRSFYIGTCNEFRALFRNVQIGESQAPPRNAEDVHYFGQSGLPATFKI